MTLSVLLKNSETNAAGFPARQYVQLGSGLSMQVNSIEPAHPGWVVEDFNASIKKHQEIQLTNLLVQGRWFFPTKPGTTLYQRCDCSHHPG